MKHENLPLEKEFEVAFAVRDVQAAEMVLAPGAAPAARTIAILGLTNGCTWCPELVWR